MRNDDVSCEALQNTLREGRELTGMDSAHLDECDTCMDAWLTLALDAKPEVPIPVNFAARVAAMAREFPVKRKTTHSPRHWGVISAMAVVTVLLVVCFEGPGSAYSTTNSWIGPAFLSLVTAEIAGLALWLGPKWIGR